MSTSMASDDDYFVVRIFGKLGAWTALYLQDQVVELEEQLMIQDQICEDPSRPDCHNGTFRRDPNIDRQHIMSNLALRLGDYQRFLLDHSQVNARMDATDFQRLYNSNNPISNAEAEFINQERDLIPVVPIIRSPLWRFIDRFPNLRQISRFGDRKRNNSFAGSDVETTIYNKESRFDNLVTGLGLGMLIAPIWLLQNLSTEKPGLNRQLTVITVFMIAFTIMIHARTAAKPYETLAATAAYGVILMVFMQPSPSAGT